MWRSVERVSEVCIIWGWIKGFPGVGGGGGECFVSCARDAGSCGRWGLGRVGGWQRGKVKDLREIAPVGGGSRG